MPKDDIAQLAKYWSDTAEDFDAIYSGRKSAFNRTLDLWLRRDMYQRFDWVLRAAGNVAGASICDIGCGSGRFSVAIAKKGASRVVGIDIAPRMLELARQLASSTQVDDVCSFIQADVLDWNPADAFDLTIAVGLFDYIADPLPRLRAIRQMTTGRFLSTWPRYWSWRTPIRKVRLSLRGCPVYFFTRRQLDGYFKAARLAIDSCEVIGKLYCVAARPV